MDPMLAFQQLLDYQPEKARHSLSVDAAHINLTNDGSYDAKGVTSKTFQTPGLHAYVVVNGKAGDTSLDTFEVVEPVAPEFDLRRAIDHRISDWFLREILINDDDAIELIFMRHDERRIVHEGVQPSDVQLVTITDKCDDLLMIIAAADDTVWVLSQSWVRTDGRMLLRIWELKDGVKKRLFEKEGVVDGDDLFGANQDWLITYYGPPTFI